MTRRNFSFRANCSGVISFSVEGMLLLCRQLLDQSIKGVTNGIPWCHDVSPQAVRSLCPCAYARILHDSIQGGIWRPWRGSKCFWPRLLHRCRTLRLLNLPRVAPMNLRTRKILGRSGNAVLPPPELRRSDICVEPWGHLISELREERNIRRPSNGARESRQRI